MAEYNWHGSLVTDASEIPGAIVIRPQHNPDMVYDPETGRTTDTRTGEWFGARLHMRTNGFYSGGIARADDATVYAYELKLQEFRHPDGTIKRVVWQVLSAKRGDWMERFRGKGTREVPAFELAQVEAQHDSLDHLAQFLRAEREAISLKSSGRIIGETVVVDRRLEDTRGERSWE